MLARHLDTQGDAGGGQFRQGGLDIAWGFLTGQRGLGPVQREQLSSGTAWRWAVKVGLCQPALEQGAVHLAAVGPFAVGIERRAAMALMPGVEQCIGWTGVEAQRGARVRGWWQQRQVGDTAKVKYQPPAIGVAKYLLMEDRCQGGCLPPAARSRRRKSATTAQPVNSASRLGLSSCKV